jgi:hypothetical protein
VPGQPLPCGYIGAGKGGDGIQAVGVTMVSICQIFSGQLHRVIIDKTGITGRFNYHLPFNTPPPGAPGDDEQFNVAMRALQRLSLKVESVKGTAELDPSPPQMRPLGYFWRAKAGYFSRAPKRMGFRIGAEPLWGRDFRFGRHLDAVRNFERFSNCWIVM